jgi:nitrite reductase/ring-hydroxylating ferredoxin subunit
MTPPTTRPECDGCALGSRRQFLGRVTGTVAAAVLCDDWTAALGATAVTDATAVQAGVTTLTYPVPAGDGVSIDKKEQIILVRYQQKVYAFPLACPHENTALRWRQGDLRFQCPRHDSKYRPDGTFMTGRATRNMDRYAVSRSGGSIVIDLTTLYQSDTHAAQWAAASAPA